MIKNPITSIIGLIVAICPIVGEIWPEAKEFCDKLIVELIGLGFIASADGVKKHNVAQGPTVGSFLIPIGLAVMFLGVTACAQLDQIGKKVISAVDSVVKTVEQATDTVADTAKDAVMLDCQDGEDASLTGCEVRNAK